MPVGFLARFLFGLALLAQSLSLPSAGFGASAPARGASASGLLCAMLHGGNAEARKNASSLAGTEQAPKSDSSHRHGLCSFCQMGSSAPPLDHYLSPVALLRVAWARPLFVSFSDGIVFFRVNHNAPARAPPTFA